jgi:uncharacterized phiE125 gp8 family phage protein
MLQPPTQSLRLVTAPTVEPVTLSEAKQHLRVTDDADNAYITNLIVAARQAVESGESWSLERSLINSTWRLTLDGFAARVSVIELPRPPVASITSITYDDAANVEQTLASNRYRLLSDAEPARVMPIYNDEWPEAINYPGSVRITYVAGYGATAASVPQAIKQAVLLLVGDMYENRESILVGVNSGVLPTVRALLNPYQWRYR